MELYTARWSRAEGWSAPLPAWDGPGTLVLAFGASTLRDEPGPLRELCSAYPGSALIGCSTAGEILHDTVSDDGVVVAVARFAATRVHLVHEKVARPGDSHDAGLSLARRLAELEPDLRGLFVLSDGLSINGSALTAGLVEGTDGRTAITGGLAGDGSDFTSTWVLVDGEPRSDHVSAVGLAGTRLRLGHGYYGGWDDFGPERRVTRAEGNVLYELDGQPALALYKRYLGDRAAGLPATALLFPLAVHVPGARDRELVRTILAVDEATQSMTFAGDIPQGSAARLMRAGLDRLIDAAHTAAANTIPATTGPPGDADSPNLAVAISCVGRRLLLTRRTEDELEAALTGLPARSEMVGFYSYGEISPISAGTCDLHNETMTLTTIAEAP
jgi:hypothetical protein